MIHAFLRLPPLDRPAEKLRGVSVGTQLARSGAALALLALAGCQSQYGTRVTPPPTYGYSTAPQAYYNPPPSATVPGAGIPATLPPGFSPTVPSAGLAAPPQWQPANPGATTPPTGGGGFYSQPPATPSGGGFYGQPPAAPNGVTYPSGAVDTSRGGAGMAVAYGAPNVLPAGFAPVASPAAGYPLGPADYRTTVIDERMDPTRLPARDARGVRAPAGAFASAGGLGAPVLYAPGAVQIAGQLTHYGTPYVAGQYGIPMAPSSAPPTVVLAQSSTAYGAAAWDGSGWGSPSGWRDQSPPAGSAVR